MMKKKGEWVWDVRWDWMGNGWGEGGNKRRRVREMRCGCVMNGMWGKLEVERDKCDVSKCEEPWNGCGEGDQWLQSEDEWSDVVCVITCVMPCVLRCVPYNLHHAIYAMPCVSCYLCYAICVILPVIPCISHLCHVIQCYLFHAICTMPSISCHRYAMHARNYLILINHLLFSILLFILTVLLLASVKGVGVQG